MTTPTPPTDVARLRELLHNAAGEAFLPPAWQEVVSLIGPLLDRLAACEEALRQIALDIEPERVVSSIGYWKAIQTARAALGGSDDR